jgi:hypothetical protein
VLQYKTEQLNETWQFIKNVTNQDMGF